jgi:hypothetical protein
MPAWLETALIIIGAAWVVFSFVIKLRSRPVGPPLKADKYDELQAIMKRLAARPPISLHLSTKSKGCGT